MAKSADLSITKSDGVSQRDRRHQHDLHDHRHQQRPLGRPGRRRRSRTPSRPARRPSETEADCAIAAGVLTCTTTAALAPGAAVDYRRHPRRQPRRYGGTSLANTATIDSSPVADPTAANNSATDTDTVAKSADLSITKTDGATSVTAGTSTTYTITVDQPGPSTVPAGVVDHGHRPGRHDRRHRTEADCAIAAGVLTCTTTATLAARRAASTTTSPWPSSPAYAGDEPDQHGHRRQLAASPTRRRQQQRHRHRHAGQEADLSITKTDGVRPASPPARARPTRSRSPTSAPRPSRRRRRSRDSVPAGTTPVRDARPTAPSPTGVLTCTTHGRPGARRAASTMTSPWPVEPVATRHEPGQHGHDRQLDRSPTRPRQQQRDRHRTRSAKSADLSITKTDGVDQRDRRHRARPTRSPSTNLGPSAVPAGVVDHGHRPGRHDARPRAEADCAIAAGVLTCTTTAALAPGASVDYDLTLAVSPTLCRHEPGQHGHHRQLARSPIRPAPTTARPTPTRWPRAPTCRSPRPTASPA